jgi:two-component system, LuxR family, sensor kinase FixL
MNTGTPDTPTPTQTQVDAAVHDIAMRLRSVVDTAADGIITINERGIIDSANPAAAKMFGYTTEELIGRNVSILMPEPHAREHDGYLANYLRTGKASIIGIGRELTALQRDGTTFPIRLAVSEMILSGKRCFTGIVADLSERRRLERQVLETAAAEQRRIGQDLHDGVCQAMAAMSFSLEMVRRKLSRSEPVEPAQLDKIQRMLQESSFNLRQLAHGLQPVHFRAGGLPEALRELATTISERFQVSCRARCTANAMVSDEATAEHLYRIAQEAAGNAVKHGKADTVRIHLAVPPPGGLALAVVDNGIGFDVADAPVAPHAPFVPKGGHGMGLRIMKYRADAIGADFRIRPRRRRGAIVWCALPPRRS